MKKILLITICLFVLETLNAQSYEWAKSFSGSSVKVGESIYIDDLGNVYTTGYFSGTVDFDPGAGVYNLTSAGGRDVFVQKMDSNGNFLWAKSLGGAQNDMSNSIVIDNTGNLYITGSFLGTADFDPNIGTTSLTSAGGSDIFVQKMDAMGNLLWVKSLEGTGNDSGESIALDGFGNVYITGSFQATIDFDPGPGTMNLTSNGSNEVFVLKMNGSGVFIWAKSFGGTASDGGVSITIDTYGHIYTAGIFNGIVDFDPGTGIVNLTQVNGVFVQKMDASGNFIWAKSSGVGALNPDFGLSVMTDASGNVYSTGCFQGTTDFDPGAGTNDITSAGSYDVFVQKMDSNGNFLWAKSFGGASSDIGYSVKVDASNNVFVTGHFGGIVDFDTGAGTSYLYSNGLVDAFVLKMDASGDFLWAKSFGGVIEDGGRSIAVDASNNLYTIGYFYGTVDFDPSSETANLFTEGYGDIFVLKLSPCFTASGTDSITACDSYTWIDGNTYTISNNTATHTFITAAGCDSLATLNLTINSSTAGTDSITACDLYTWIDGNTYTASNNTAIYTVINSAGCDSLVTLNLTIKNSNTGTDVITACDSYTWIDGNTYTASNNTAVYTLINTAGCDSVVTLSLTINNSTTGTDSITACDSYTWIDGNTYSVSNNTSTYTLFNSAGCDSVVTLNLTINNSNTGTDTVTAIDSYTWIDGNTYTESNDTATYVLTNAVGCDSLITLNLTIETTSDSGSEINVFPNPTNGNFYLDLGSVTDAEISISTGGQVIDNISVIQDQGVNLIIDGPAGIYFVTVYLSTGATTITLVKL